MLGDSRFRESTSLQCRPRTCQGGLGAQLWPFPFPAKEGQRVQGGPSTQCTAFYKETATMFCPWSGKQTLPMGGLPLS